MQCIKCKTDGTLSRTKRAGFLEEHIFSYIGYYPWLCSGCKRRILLKKRNSSRSFRPRDESDSGMQHTHPNRNGLHEV
jgi:hypothetical protein